jgi:hypothetical protein
MRTLTLGARNCIAVTGAMATREPNIVHLYPNLSTTIPVKNRPIIWPTFVICLRIVCCPALADQLEPTGQAIGKELKLWIAHLILYFPEGSISPYF